MGAMASVGWTANRGVTTGPRLGVVEWVCIQRTLPRRALRLYPPTFHCFSTGITSLANSLIEVSALAKGIPPKRNELFSS
jgi:hypothetical protein